MLEMLLNSNPNLYNQCIDVLKNAVKETEVRCNAVKGTFAFRPLRLDDVGFGAKTWQMVFRAETECRIADIINPLTVPTDNSWVYFGWITDTDLGVNSSFSYYREGVLKSEISSTIVYNCENPVHMFIDIQNISISKENDRMDFKVYNNNEYDIVANVIPILYRIASASALNMYHSRFNKVSDKVQMPVTKKSGVDLSRILSEISRLQAFVNPKPMDYVKVKDENNIERDEVRAKLDPNYKSWIETLKDVEVCAYCGSTIERVYSSQYCHYCGVKMKKKGKIK